MFAMRDEEALVFFACLFAAGLCVWMVLRHKLHTERLRVLHRALDSGNLDEATKRKLLEVLVADSQVWSSMWRAVSVNAAKVVRTLLFVGGWLTFTISGVVLTAMLVFDNASRYDIQAASIAVAIGFGLVTLPLALREMDARRAVRG